MMASTFFSIIGNGKNKLKKKKNQRFSNSYRMSQSKMSKSRNDISKHLSHTSKTTQENAKKNIDLLARFQTEFKKIYTQIIH